MKIFLRRYRWVIIASFVIAVIGTVARRFTFHPPMPWAAEALIFFVTIAVFLGFWFFFANINQQLDKVFPFERNIGLRVAIQLLIGTLLVLVIRVAGFELFSSRAMGDIRHMIHFLVIGANIFMALALNLAVMSGYLIQLWKKGLVRAENLEKEKARMQYHMLRNQVNPHFLFNSFSIVQGLIRTNPAVADTYVGHLAKVYRYAIQHKEKEIVRLEDELAIFEHYQKVLGIRYAEALEMQIDLDPDTKARGIAMVTLQMLTDNAIKHNEIHPSRILKIRLYAEGDYLVFANNYQERPSLIPSNGEGLQQLKALYMYYTEKPLCYGMEGADFVVRIPLLDDL